MNAKTIVEQTVERWNAHDRDGYLEFYDEAMSFFDAPSGHELRGREEFGKGFYDLWTEAYPDNKIKDPVVFTDGEKVCFQGRFTGTHTGVLHSPDMELPPTGKPVDTPFVFISEIRGGKIRSGRIFYDRLVALEQEGIISPDQFAALTVA